MLENWPLEEGVMLNDGKFDRWLGFVQGALWAMDIKDIDTFRDDTRQGINNAFEKLKEYLAV